MAGSDTSGAIDDLSVGYCAGCTPPRSGLLRSDLMRWPICDLPGRDGLVRSLGGTHSILAPKLRCAVDLAACLQCSSRAHP
jgi:hypothetical protein